MTSARPAIHPFRISHMTSRVTKTTLAARPRISRGAFRWMISCLAMTLGAFEKPPRKFRRSPARGCGSGERHRAQAHPDQADLIPLTFAQSAPRSRPAARLPSNEPERGDALVEPVFERVAPQCAIEEGQHDRVVEPDGDPGRDQHDRSTDRMIGVDRTNARPAPRFRATVRTVVTPRRPVSGPRRTRYRSRRPRRRRRPGRTPTRSGRPAAISPAAAYPTAIDPNSLIASRAFAASSSSSGAMSGRMLAFAGA